METQLIVLPTEQVHRYWHHAEPLLAKAIDKGHDEFTLDNLEYACSQGQQQLLLVMNNGICECALTVIFYNYPKYRSCYITYIGGKNTKDGWDKFKQWVKDNGADRICGSAASESIVKLWNKYYGFKPIYTYVQLKLED